MLIQQMEILHDNNFRPFLQSINDYNYEFMDSDGILCSAIFCKEVLHLDKYDNEHSLIISINGDGHINSFYISDIGNQLCCDPLQHLRSISIFLILSGAKEFITIHNHPSVLNKNTEPSDEDIEVLTEFIQLGNTIGIPMKGDLIIGNTGWYNIMKNQFYPYDLDDYYDTIYDTIYLER